MAAASGDRPIQNVLGNPDDFNDLYRPPSVKVVFFTIASAKNTGAILILRIGSAASIPIASHERNLERYKIISCVPPISRLDDASALSGHPSSPWQRRTNVLNKSGTGGKAIKKARNPASRSHPNDQLAVLDLRHFRRQLALSGRPMSELKLQSPSPNFI